MDVVAPPVHLTAPTAVNSFDERGTARSELSIARIRNRDEVASDGPKTLRTNRSAPCQQKVLTSGERYPVVAERYRARPRDHGAPGRGDRDRDGHRNAGSFGVLGYGVDCYLAGQDHLGLDCAVPNERRGGHHERDSNQSCSGRVEPHMALQRSQTKQTRSNHQLMGGPVRDRCSGAPG